MPTVKLTTHEIDALIHAANYWETVLEDRQDEGDPDADEERGILSSATARLAIARRQGSS